MDLDLRGVERTADLMDEWPFSPKDVPCMVQCCSCDLLIAFLTHQLSDTGVVDPWQNSDRAVKTV